MKYTAENYPAYMDWKIRGLLRVLEKHGVNINSSSILDFGCQYNSNIDALRASGLDIYGFDIGDPCEEGVVRRASINDYKIPWPGNTFDAIYSHHVFEHVQDHETALAELYRVLKPNGLMIHLFPSRWRIMEAHYYTPFGGVFNGVWWCTLWGWLKKPGRKHISLKEYGKLASKSIREELNYPPKDKLFGYFERYFSIRNVLCDYVCEIRGINLHPVVECLLSEFHVRALLCRPLKSA